MSSLNKYSVDYSKNLSRFRQSASTWIYLQWEDNMTRQTSTYLCTELALIKLNKMNKNNRVSISNKP